MVDGLLEIYNLMNQDMPTTANLDMSLISDAILLCNERLQADGRQLPKGLRVHADNCTSETKNQVAFKTGAFLLHQGFFDVVVWSYFQTGHSHGLPDQRFSEVRHLLFQESTLQTPADFVKVLEKVKPRQQRDLLVQKVECMENWNEFLEPLQISLHGHNTTHRMKQSGLHACHYFLMVTREKYDQFGDAGMVENFEDEPPHPKDIVLVVKSHLSSEDISQKPFVFLPASALQNLQGWPEYTVQLNKMSKDTEKELRKTMEKITQPPWHMRDAAEYITQLIDQQGTVPQVNRGHPLEELSKQLKSEQPKPDQSVFKAGPTLKISFSLHDSIVYVVAFKYRWWWRQTFSETEL